MFSQNQKFYFFAFIILSVFILLLAAVSEILFPFITGIIIAYFLSPLVDKIEAKTHSRGLSSFIILTLFITILIVIYHTLGPKILSDFSALTSNIPKFIKFLESYYNNTILEYSALLRDNLPGKFENNSIANNGDFLNRVSNFIINFIGKFLSNILQSGIVLINFLSLIFVTPIITFYLLKDWHKGVKHLKRLVPKAQEKPIFNMFKQIDIALSAYIRGQSSVCFILGFFYAIGLSLVGLKHGFTIGLLTGIFTFIPFFGVLIGMILGVLVAIFQFQSLFMVFVVLAIFLIGQFIEGNFITPNLVGNKIGIHPVIIIFSLLAAGKLIGFVGVLFALPISAVIGVIIRTIVKSYNNSKFYKFNPRKKSKKFHA